MNRNLYNHVISVLRPIAVPIGMVFRFGYWIAIGWWYEPRLLSQQVRELSMELERSYWFLFSERKGRRIANRALGHLRDLKPAVVTIEAEGLLFRFVRWRDTLKVHVSSSQLPDEWHELDAILETLGLTKKCANDLTYDRSATVLRESFEQLRAALSAANVNHLRADLDQRRARDLNATVETQAEINRNLYQR